MKAPVKAVCAALAACFVVVLLWTPLVHAQDAGTASTAAVTAPAATDAPAGAPAVTAPSPAVTAPAGAVPVPPTITDPGHDPNYLDKLLKAAETSNWKLLAILIVIGAVWLVRTVGGKKWPILKTDRAGAICTLVLGAAGAVGNAIAAGGAITPRLFLNGLMMGITAAGGWVVVKKLLFPSDAKAATPTAPATPPTA